jgi:hypothetical protein
MAGASEPGRIVVQRAAVVDGPTITLGDLARARRQRRGARRRRPRPGAVGGAPRRLDGAAILRRLEQAGMDASATRYVDSRRPCASSASRKR